MEVSGTGVTGSGVDETGSCGPELLTPEESVVEPSIDELSKLEVSGEIFIDPLFDSLKDKSGTFIWPLLLLPQHKMPSS